MRVKFQYELLLESFDRSTINVKFQYFVDFKKMLVFDFRVLQNRHNRLDVTATA